MPESCSGCLGARVLGSPDLLSQEWHLPGMGAHSGHSAEEGAGRRICQELSDLLITQGFNWPPHPQLLRASPP